MKTIKRLGSAMILAFVMAGSVFADGNSNQNPISPIGRQPDLPRFEDFKVDVTKETPKAVRIEGKNATQFRTRLREAQAEGVNFAGHYIIASWGCGTSCEQAAIIDATTGKVYFPDELFRGFGISLGHPEESLEKYGYFEFRPDSQLLILNGYGGPKYGVRYLVWDENEFHLAKFVPISLPD
ncbi:MAG: hypothetical protein DWQ47_10780 [Acidobacteria bacterium]|nr:MAG: hypothetical protein DWQ32_13195 [Acidobacteriota bacterium]REJ98069.1 MAG: hypothetical protein DWQ38_15995 [Acidobacteriota bacterium]REK16812.1 MAG: hypothetical protein DWQ43_01040 [Acidobacteriota bacterium]REK42723.1 MAG: hypothetical protein DWQ47_10780 [Acidobacteriota bacterium]